MFTIKKNDVGEKKKRFSIKNWIKSPENVRNCEKKNLLNFHKNSSKKNFIDIFQFSIVLSGLRLLIPPVFVRGFVPPPEAPDAL